MMAAPPQDPRRATPHHDTQAGDLPAMSEVMAQIATEVTMPLTAALARLASLTAQGQFNGASLQALHGEINRARHVGLRGQQIARLMTGQVKPMNERLDLPELLRDVLTEMVLQGASADTHQQGGLPKLDVVGDTSLMATLLTAAAEWAQSQAVAPVMWQLDVQASTGRAQLTCQFVRRMSPLIPHQLGAVRMLPPASPPLENLDWLLLQCTAHLAGVMVLRQDAATQTQLLLTFSQTVLADSSAQARPQPGDLLGGIQVLVMSGRKEARREIRQAMRGHELFIDFVPSLEAAHQYCEEGAPQVLIFDASFSGDGLRALCRRVSEASPGIALIEIVADGSLQEVDDFAPFGPIHKLGALSLHRLLPDTVRRALSTRQAN